MPNPDLIPVPFAQNGQKNTIQLDRIVSDPAYRATWAEGFPADTRIPKEVGGEGPDGLDFNGILNALSQAVVFLQKGNSYQFDASLAPYPIGALVRSNDNLTTYQSTIASNSNNPNSNMTGWRVYNTVDFIKEATTTVKGVARFATTQEVINRANVNAIVRPVDIPQPAGVPDASTTQKGVVRAATATEVANKSNVNAYVTPSNAALIAQSTGIGVGQSWQDVTGSRSAGLTYTNNTGCPIQVFINLTDVAPGTVLYLNGISTGEIDFGSIGRQQLSFIIPNASTYQLSVGASVGKWLELR